MYLLAPVSAQVDRIEAEKLKAVGLRNRVAALEEVRSGSARNGSPILPPLPPYYLPTLADKIRHLVGILGFCIGAPPETEGSGALAGREARGTGAVSGAYRQLC